MQRRRLLSAGLTVLTVLGVVWSTALPSHSATVVQSSSQPFAQTNKEQVVNVIVAGATGNLAAKYLWISMFRMALGGKPISRRTFRFFAGASDTLERGRIWHEKFFDEKFAERVCGAQKDKISPEQIKCHGFLETEFKTNVTYAPLRTKNHYQELGKKLKELNEDSREEGRIVYLAIPPQFFLQSCEMIHRYLRPQRSESDAPAPFLRVVVEKPFGRDLQSAHELSTRLRTFYSKDELFVMDHYAGKPVVNALRNFFQLNAAALHPIWNSKYVDNIHIEMTETATLQNRVHYFDSAGIIRDIIVNHLQLLLNVAVAPSFGPATLSPISESASRVHEAQLRFIKALQAPNHLTRESLFVAQQYDEYAAHYAAEMIQSIDESTHFTPTAAWITLTSSLQEWRNTTFHLAAAKATAERLLSITVTFRDGVFQAQQCAFTVIIQRAINTDPREGQKIEWSCDVSNLVTDLQLPNGWEYLDVDDHCVIVPKTHGHETAAWELGDEPSAYDFLLQEIAKGAIEHFADLDEVEAAWALWTPVVNAAEAIAPDSQKHELYTVGTSPWKQLHSKPRSAGSQAAKEEL